MGNGKSNRKDLIVQLNSLHGSYRDSSVMSIEHSYSRPRQINFNALEEQLEPKKPSKKSRNLQNFGFPQQNEQYYTPYHNYNTRLSAKLFKTPQNLPVALNFHRSRKDQNEDTYLIEKFENSSDRFSVASSNCFGDSFEGFLETQERNCCDEYIKKSLKEFKEPMEVMDPPCASDRKRWIQNGSIAFAVGWYINYVRLQFAKVRTDIDLANGRISDIVDARLDTLYKLSEVGNMVKELKQSQDNFKSTIQKMVESEINKMYSDKTGRTDFALESAGGRIVRLSSETENYGQQKSYLGISLCEGMHGPRAMIQTGTSPGECWALKGSNGGVIVKLLGPIKIDAVSMEHISKSISPSGDSKTAPKDFTVWGLKTSIETGTLLGQFSYRIDDTLVQTFHVSHPVSEFYEFIELKILSNHGNPDFTCVYRFRVHGTLEQ